MDIDKPTSSSSSTASGSASTADKVKKFKLDPMSLLLPHERQMYAASHAVGSQHPTGGSQAGQGPIHKGPGPFGQPGMQGLGFMYQAQASQSQAGRNAAQQGARQTSSYGDQSGKRGPQPPTHHYQPPPQAHYAQQGQSSPTTSSHPGSSTTGWDAQSSSTATSYPRPPTSSSTSPNLSQQYHHHHHHHPHHQHRGPTAGQSYGRSPGTGAGGSGEGKVRLEDWEIVETLGTGTFGRVLLVRQRPSYRTTPYHPIFPHLFQTLDPLAPTPQATASADGQLPHFAMKVLRKSEIVRLKQVEHINSERAILDRIRHPFIVELYSTYQDNLNVYMLLSYIPGGELFSHLRRAGRFSPDVTRFYLASIILAVEYLHSRNIIYRDLKPENLLLDRVGYLRIADFGFAKIVEDRTFTLCGTPEYLAPEIVLSQGHGKAVDWWALGILAFEMLAGYPPFFDDHPLGIYEKILRNEVAFPAHIDPYGKDLIRGLLTTDRSKRLGNLRGGAKDVMEHPWFAGVDWGSLERKEIGAPIVPRVANMGDSQNFQRYPPPRPTELPGIFGEAYNYEADQYGSLFHDFTFPARPQLRTPVSPAAAQMTPQPTSTATQP